MKESRKFGFFEVFIVGHGQGDAHVADTLRVIPAALVEILLKDFIHFLEIVCVSHVTSWAKFISITTSFLTLFSQSKSKMILSQGVARRPVLENFKRQPEIFLCTAASETERERP